MAFSYDMVIVPIDGEGRDNLIEKYPFFPQHDPGQYIQQQRGRGERIRFYNIMLVNKDVSDDMVYDML